MAQQQIVLASRGTIKQFGGSAVDPSQVIKNSYLELRFYKDNTGGYFKRFVPFLGDIAVTESRKANYVNYSPISRNTQIPFYTGSDSRIFKIVYEIAPAFLQQSDNFSFLLTILTGALVGDTKTPASDKDLFLATSQSQSMPLIFSYRTRGLPPENKDEIIVRFIDYQINLIRSTVINNAIKPTLGPPLVRLNHGILYQNIPCICLDYNVEQQYQDSSKKQYGPVSKISAYKTVITFTLQEIRNGNFLSTPFNHTDSIAQDNIVGWEQIIETGHGSLDPITPIYK